MDDTREVSTSRKMVLVALAVVAVVVVVVALVAILGKSLDGYFKHSLVNTTYMNAGVKYDLKFYSHSTEQLANGLDWMTQGGRKPLSGSTTVLVSPALGRYGTGVALFIVPIPADRLPVLQKDHCSDMPALSQTASVTMQADNSQAIVCGQTGNNNKQVEYLFQFSQHGTTYDGFVLQPYNWKQVTSNPATAKAFLSYANLAKYNKDIEAIIRSITVQ